MLSAASSSSFLPLSAYPCPKISGNRSLPPPSPLRFRPPHAAAAGTESAERSGPSTCLFSPRMASSSLYEILGIPIGASGDEIKAAYRNLARTCHPDVAAAGTREGSPTDEFVRINAAYSTLSDPEKRANYDRNLFQRNRCYISISASPAASSSRFSGYTGRNWETDQCW